MGNRCKECGKELFGRSDKKFCDEQCRNTYNNAKNRGCKLEIHSINRVLLKNFQILKKIHSGGTKRINKAELSLLGFDFRYITSFRYRKDGRVIMCCYNYSYTEYNNDTIYISINNSSKLVK